MILHSWAAIAHDEDPGSQNSSKNSSEINQKTEKNSSTKKGQHPVMEPAAKNWAAFRRAIKCEQKSQQPSWVGCAGGVTP